MVATYREFLKSGFWADLRYQKLEVNPRCERCNSTLRLQVHHKRYQKSWYDTSVADLETLCRACHRKEHGKGESMNAVGRMRITRRRIRKIMRSLPRVVPVTMSVSRLRRHGTNNEAEFDALLAGLAWINQALPAGGFLHKDFSIRLFTDSTVVGFRINRTNASNKTEPEKRMFSLAAKCLETLIRFSACEVTLIGREKNVALFGH